MISKTLFTAFLDPLFQVLRRNCQIGLIKGAVAKSGYLRPLSQRKEVQFGNTVPIHTVVSLPYPIHLGGKMKSKAIQKSEVVNLRCQKVGQYCKYGLKY